MSWFKTMTRRQALCAASAALCAAPVMALAARAEEAPRVNDDGLYEEPWFLQSFLVLAEDLEMATSNGKRFAVMWELRGCPYCKETHLVNFADPEIRGFVQEHFDMLQLNVLGARRVVDFDGEELEERELARKWGVRFTPTTCFYPDLETVEGGVPGHELEVARMPGYFRPPHFLAMFRYVREKAYEETDFRSYLSTLQSSDLSSEAIHIRS
jgi:thioredoxin-related protein